MDQQRSRAAATPTTTEQAPPTPGQAAAPEPVVTGCLYEAGFSTTGPHPQGGVAIARSIHDARQRLADMLTFCDPTATAVADITAFTPTHTVARYSGTVAELFADFNTGTPDRTVHARPLVGLATPALRGQAAVRRAAHRTTSPLEWGHGRAHQSRNPAA